MSADNLAGLREHTQNLVIKLEQDLVQARKVLELLEPREAAPAKLEERPKRTRRQKRSQAAKRQNNTNPLKEDTKEQILLLAGEGKTEISSPVLADKFKNISNSSLTRWLKELEDEGKLVSMQERMEGEAGTPRKRYSLKLQGEDAIPNPPSRTH